MGTFSGILGQVAPVAATLTVLYSAPVRPAAKYARAKVIAANRGVASDTFRIAISPNGVPIAVAHYVAYDKAIGANDSLASVEVTIGSGDVVRVYSAGGSMSFTFTGEEYG